MPLELEMEIPVSWLSEGGGVEGRAGRRGRRRKEEEEEEEERSTSSTRTVPCKRIRKCKNVRSTPFMHMFVSCVMCISACIIILCAMQCTFSSCLVCHHFYTFGLSGCNLRFEYGGTPYLLYDLFLLLLIKI